MVKSLLPVFMSSAGVAAVGVAGYVAVNQPSEPDAVPKPEPVIKQQAPVEEQTALLSVPETKSPEPVVALPQEDVADPRLPAFSVIRVEPDGNGVIAGTGEPLQVLQLFDGEIMIAETKTGPTGDFAIVLEKPLAPGLHQLTLRTVGPDGETLVSEEAGLVNVPLPDNPTELTVLVSKPGEASRILAKPEELELAVPEIQVAKISEPEVQSSAVEEPKEVASVEVKTETPDVAVKIDEPAVETVAVKPVLIGAVETEDESMFIAGTGEPGSMINLYLGSEYLGQVRVGENGAFLFEGKKALDPGRYEIRADMLIGADNDVVSRAAVDLVHEPDAAIAERNEQPVEEPQVAETTEPAVQSAEAEAEPVQPVEATEAKPEIRTGTAVIIRRGDSLWKVARRNYGAGVRYTTIFNANRDQVRNPDLIYPGQVLKVPEGETDEAQTSDG